MAQLERRKKYSESPQSPLSQASPASDHLIRAEEYWVTNASPGGRVCHDHEHEECPSHCPSHGKKSVLAKVKEGAKKLKYSLSGRRKHMDLHDSGHHHHYHHPSPVPGPSPIHYSNRNSHSHSNNYSHSNGQSHSNSHSHSHEDNHDRSHEDNHDQEKHYDHVTPCWTATLEDDYLDEKDYDPEYLGAPMYESEAAPECLRETARQHPRASPVVSESHKVPNMAKQENPNTNTSTMTNMTQNLTEKVSDKLAQARAAVSDATGQINTNTVSNMTGTVYDATHQITSKLAGINIASPGTQERGHEASGYYEVKEMNEGTGNLMRCTSGNQTWDKGVSVKEYFLHKLEPGEDERALSQAITEAISPRKSSGEAGVVDKVKGAVSSLFRHEDASNSTRYETLGSDDSVTSNTPSSVQMNHASSVRIDKPASPPLSAPATSNAPRLNRLPSVHVPTSNILNRDAVSSPLQVYEEENHGKILQTN